MEHDDDETVSILEPVTEWRTNHTGKLREARRGKRSIFAARMRMCVCVCLCLCLCLYLSALCDPGAELRI